jgi:putative pyruvate formate lyase activating enzyme
MAICNACPRGCSIDRITTTGFCGRTEEIEISRAAPHYWEEPCLSGDKGSGTVFFTGCNLGCVFCQNYLISRRKAEGKTVTAEELLNIFEDLESKGVHNVNLVTPSHYIHQLIPILERAKRHISIPIVWNSNGYENVDDVRLLDGLVDIYLPDLKFRSADLAKRLCSAEDYFEKAVLAIEEMKRQRPVNIFDEDGMMKEGLIIRHLVLPNHSMESISILKEIKERFSADTCLSIMCQYIPEGEADKHPDINRRLKRKEYARVIEYASKLGFTNGFTQEFTSADESFIPEFSLKKET